MANDAEYEELIAVIRALIISRNRITTLGDINREYRLMEEENIPFRRFGCKSLEDFLRKAGQFNLCMQNDGEVK